MRAFYLKFRYALLGFCLVTLTLSALLQLVHEKYIAGLVFAILAVSLLLLDRWIWLPSERPQLKSLVQQIKQDGETIQLGDLTLVLSEITKIETGFIDQQRAYLLLHSNGSQQSPRRLYFPSTELAEVRIALAQIIAPERLTQADFHLL